ncbi:MAG: hypothetical protein A2007_04290 [Verrucomicrobia bacterium GWC2_42_7]|nr:MAG: hypothetical protein A2007_04290 [Verrucomicrobia bacterium GWC2_42_7]
MKKKEVPDLPQEKPMIRLKKFFEFVQPNGIRFIHFLGNNLLFASIDFKLTIVKPKSLSF